MTTEQLWLTPAEAAPILGYKDLQSLYRDIREKQFPFRFIRTGKRIRICARSIGAIPEGKAENSEAQIQDQSLATAA